MTARYGYEFAPGSLIVERYVWRNGEKRGVQWLAQIVTPNGDYELVKLCKTKAEAISAICEAGVRS